MRKAQAQRLIREMAADLMPSPEAAARRMVSASPGEPSTHTAKFAKARRNPLPYRRFSLPPPALPPPPVPPPPHRSLPVRSQFADGLRTVRSKASRHLHFF